MTKCSHFIDEEFPHDAVPLPNAPFILLGWSTIEMLNRSGCPTWVLALDPVDPFIIRSLIDDRDYQVGRSIKGHTVRVLQRAGLFKI